MDDPAAASSSRAASEEDDDEEEYEEPGGGNRLLGFMFGNVDPSGDLDAEYLDEDAKEHLAALADKLGASLTEIELTKSPSASSGTSEQDYDKKAEDAVDYEDIEEQYEGPEVQAAAEEDHLLRKKEYLVMGVSLASVNKKSSVFDDENYDEDEEIVKENEGEKDNSDFPAIPKEGQELEVVTEKVELPHDYASSDACSDMEHVPSGEGLQDKPTTLQGHTDSDATAPLPVLCVEDGMVILRFSEIFGVHEPLRKKERKTRQQHYSSKDHVQSSFSTDEDEENFLKTFQCDPQISRNLILSQNAHVPIKESGAGELPFSIDERRKKLYSDGQPMKDSQAVDICTGWTAPVIPNFYPLEQQDWEDKIIWGNSPPRSDWTQNSVASESDTDSFHGVEECNKHESMVKDSCMESTADVRDSFTTQTMEGFHHPQILGVESMRGKDSAETKTNIDNEPFGGNLLQWFNKLSLQNRDLVEGSWLDNIIWDPDMPFSKPKLIVDLQDEHMLFETLEHNDVGTSNGATLQCSNLQKSAIGDAHDHSASFGASVGRFNISNDKYYASKKTSQPLKAHAKKRSVYGLKIVHSVPALRLQTMEPRLSNKEIINFHGPKALWYPHDNKEATKLQGELRNQGSFKVILKTLSGKIILLRVGAQELVSSVIAKSSKKLDFRSTEKATLMYNRKELQENESLSSQNVRPNSMLHVLRTKIHLWPRAQKLPGDNKPLRPPGAFKKKSELSVKDGHVALVEYCEEHPLLLGNVGMGARVCTYYQKSTPADQTASSLRNGNNGLGNVVALDPADKSPFLGEISPGCTQSSIETNMYRAPIFPHELPSTDYLLVRSAKGTLSLRRIDKIFAAGQQEPHMEVMSPGTKNVQNYVWNRLLVYVYREFRAKEKAGLTPSIRADELSLKFPSVADSFLRKRLKHCADLQRGFKGQLFWEMRPSFRIPSEDELRRMVTPENVCSYESMQAGLHRLRSLGIRCLTLPVGLSAAMNRLPDEAIALAAASHIERELQITSWNLSSNFVACTHLDRENIERLEITGVGDPSGRGLGFSYVRVAPKTGTSTPAKKKTPANRGGSTVTGTDADLRRLSMDAAREVLLKFNVPEENIGKMTRWHRIAMIRKLSSEQAASGIKVDTETLNKFARGQRMSFVQLQQQAREKCQEIWDRQVQSLSAVDGDENYSDSEANSDLDSFAGDLENLLDAEEFEEGEEGNIGSKGDKIDGVKGLKMRRCPPQTKTEEEIEEEEIEVAVIRRLLDADEYAAKMKRKMISSENQQKIGSEVAEGKRPTNITGQATSISKNDLSCASKDVLEQDPYEVDASLVETISGKAEAKRGNGKIEELPSVKSKKQMKPVKGGKVVKEKKPFDKPVRENFVCGACGQLGHMRTNKNCPKYGGDLETPESESVSGKSHLPGGTSGPQLKTPSKKLAHKGIVKTPTSDAIGNSEKPVQKLKARVPSLKVKCGPPPLEKHPENTNGLQLSVEQIGGTTSGDIETETKSSGKINKIIISSKSKPEAVQPEVPKPAVVIRVSGETDRERRRKKIIIKKPRSATEFENLRHGGDVLMEEEVRKTKKIAELASLEERRMQHIQWVAEDVRREVSENRRLREEEEKRRSKQRISEERTRRILEEERIMAEEKQRHYEMKVRKELEERAKAKKKKKKKKPDFRDEYMEEYTSSRRDRRIPKRDRAAKRRPAIDLGRHAADYGPPTKRRRGGEVLLSNILESIVDKLRDNTAVSYLFLKPVTKKEAPDYFKYIERPMDLSTIKERVRRMEYKNREDFRHDVWQITFNAHKYNDGRNPGIPPLADQLLELCDYLLGTNNQSLTEAEAGIEHVDI